MAKTPWEMAAVGAEFSHQSALFAWAAMARIFGVRAANDPLSYTKQGHALVTYGLPPGTYTMTLDGRSPHPEAVHELKWLHAIKNQGHGDRVRGSRSKAEGVREGVFDVFLPVVALRQPPWQNQPGNGLPRLAGLYLELKTPDRINHKNGGASDAQLEFQAFAREQGYAAEVVHGWEMARDVLLTYLGKSNAL